MPHKTGIAAWIASAWGQIGASTQPLIILIVSLAGRTIYKGGRWSEFIGEAILLCVIFHFAAPRIAALLPGMSPGEAAALVGLAGIHGLRWLVKKKTGLDLNNMEDTKNG